MVREFTEQEIIDLLDAIEDARDKVLPGSENDKRLEALSAKLKMMMAEYA